MSKETISEQELSEFLKAIEVADYENAKNMARTNTGNPALLKIVLKFEWPNYAFKESYSDITTFYPNDKTLIQFILNQPGDSTQKLRAIEEFIKMGAPVFKEDLPNIRRLRKCQLREPKYKIDPEDIKALALLKNPFFISAILIGLGTGLALGLLGVTGIGAAIGLGIAAFFTALIIITATLIFNHIKIAPMRANATVEHIKELAQKAVPEHEKRTTPAIKIRWPVIIDNSGNPYGNRVFFYKAILVYYNEKLTDAITKYAAQKVLTAHFSNQSTTQLELIQHHLMLLDYPALKSLFDQALAGKKEGAKEQEQQNTKDFPEEKTALQNAEEPKPERRVFSVERKAFGVMYEPIKIFEAELANPKTAKNAKAELRKQIDGLNQEALTFFKETLDSLRETVLKDAPNFKKFVDEELFKDVGRKPTSTLSLNTTKQTQL